MGGGIDTAYAVHGVVAVLVTLAVVWVWYRPVPMPLKAAALATAALLTTPYVLDYDLILLAIPIALLTVDGVRTEFLSGEKIILFAAWLLPLFSRIIGAFGVPIGPVVLLLLFVAILQRAVAASGVANPMATPEWRPAG